MPKRTATRPTVRYRPATETPRYETVTDRQEERRPRGAELEPRLGPYEFRYPVDHGYTVSRYS